MSDNSHSASDCIGDMAATATGLIEAGFLYADDRPSEEVGPSCTSRMP